jgi:hypothetical protein
MPNANQWWDYRPSQSGAATPTGDSRHEWTRNYIEAMLASSPEYIQNLQTAQWGLSPSQMQRQFSAYQRGIEPTYSRQISDINAALNASGMGGGSTGINARAGVRGRQATAEQDFWNQLAMQNILAQQQGKQFAAQTATDWQKAMGGLALGYQGELMDAEKFWNMLAQGYFRREEEGTDWASILGGLGEVALPIAASAAGIPIPPI